jgi:hypothetical protein
LGWHWNALTEVSRQSASTYGHANPGRGARFIGDSAAIIGQGDQVGIGGCDFFAIIRETCAATVPDAPGKEGHGSKSDDDDLWDRL